jgi:hypothetical protein
MIISKRYGVLFMGFGNLTYLLFAFFQKSSDDKKQQKWFQLVFMLNGDKSIMVEI